MKINNYTKSYTDLSVYKIFNLSLRKFNNFFLQKKFLGCKVGDTKWSMNIKQFQQQRCFFKFLLYQSKNLGCNFFKECSYSSIFTPTSFELKVKYRQLQQMGFYKRKSLFDINKKQYTKLLEYKFFGHKSFFFFKKIEARRFFVYSQIAYQIFFYLTCNILIKILQVKKKKRNLTKNTRTFFNKNFIKNVLRDKFNKIFIKLFFLKKFRIKHLFNAKRFLIKKNIYVDLKIFFFYDPGFFFFKLNLKKKRQQRFKNDFIIYIQTRKANRRHLHSTFFLLVQRRVLRNISKLIRFFYKRLKTLTYDDLNKRQKNLWSRSGKKHLRFFLWAFIGRRAFRKLFLKKRKLPFFKKFRQRYSWTKKQYWFQFWKYQWNIFLNFFLPYSFTCFLEKYFFFFLKLTFLKNFFQIYTILFPLKTKFFSAITFHNFSQLSIGYDIFNFFSCWLSKQFYFFQVRRKNFFNWSLKKKNFISVRSHWFKFIMLYQKIRCFSYYYMLDQNDAVAVELSVEDYDYSSSIRQLINKKKVNSTLRNDIAIQKIAAHICLDLTKYQHFTYAQNYLKIFENGIEDILSQPKKHSLYLFFQQLQTEKLSVVSRKKFISLRVKWFRLYQNNRRLFQFFYFLHYHKQHRLTKYLAFLLKRRPLDFLLNNELTLSNVLIRSRLALTHKHALDLIWLGFVYVNGQSKKHKLYVLKQYDRVQVVYIENYLLNYQYVCARLLQQQSRIQYCFNRWYKHRLNFYKQHPTRFPNWLTKLFFYKLDIPKFLEVDFYTLTLVILRHPIFYTELNFYFYKYINVYFLRLYNWKYTT